MIILCFYVKIRHLIFVYRQGKFFYAYNNKLKTNKEGKWKKIRMQTGKNILISTTKIIILIFSALVVNYTPATLLSISTAKENMEKKYQHNWSKNSAFLLFLVNKKPIDTL